VESVRLRPPHSVISWVKPQEASSYLSSYSIPFSYLHVLWSFKRIGACAGSNSGLYPNIKVAGTSELSLVISFDRRFSFNTASSIVHFNSSRNARYDCYVIWALHAPSMHAYDLGQGLKSISSSRCSLSCYFLPIPWLSLVNLHLPRFFWAYRQWPSRVWSHNVWGPWLRWLRVQGIASRSRFIHGFSHRPIHFNLCWFQQARPNVFLSFRVARCDLSILFLLVPLHWTMEIYLFGYPCFENIILLPSCLICSDTRL